VITGLMSSERTTFDGRFYQLTDAPLEPRPVQRPRIPLLIAAHRPRMLRLAARHADQWDTFPEIPGSATEGVSDSIEERVHRFDAACRQAGRDPRSVRRSTWARADVAGDETAYRAYVRRHRALGFTDFSTVPPAPDGMAAFRRIANEVIPSLRAEMDGRT
jgi:alkanesulfonate monooxygenase SsuD/methylene tetrahydromethanopterin reductase-like flavin-dependent oxidoreductase (luciferase family)